MQWLTGPIILLTALLVNSVYGLNREQIIDAAIQEVISEEQNAHIQNSGSHKISGSTELLQAFKSASEEAVRDGKARLKFEKIINRAERRILQEKLKSASTLAEAESITEMFAHNAGSTLSQSEISKIYMQSECEEKIVNANCNSAEMKKRRTITGVCNNLQNPLWGSEGTQLRRILYPMYEDNLSKPYGASQSEGNSAFSSPYPSPREVSLEVIQADSVKSNSFQTHTLMLMQWGQFLDHDLDSTPAEGFCQGCEVNEQCLPIRIPPDDTDKFDSSRPSPQCMLFRRSSPFCSSNVARYGNIYPREQINGLTSFIDASQVYGSTDQLSNSLRDHQTGQLRTGRRIPNHGKPSLPIDLDNHGCSGEPCFIAGDGRVNEQIALTIMHTIWMREHNRIATILKQRNPGINAEEIFQTSRAIVGAMMQKITYKDYLPIILGSAMSYIKPYTGYKNWVEPSVSNAFATAAYRFGHSQIYHLFHRLDEQNRPLSIGPLLLEDAFFHAGQYENSGGTDPILRGLMIEKSRKVDEFLKLVLTNKLFETESRDGLDLAALNIQRGRDHGLQPYVNWKNWAKYRRECGMVTGFANSDTRDRLKQLYGPTLETVDLWVGGLAEENVPGGTLGPTFACIVAETFERLRDGDRFYYEKSDGLFNAKQIASIERTSLARVICDNSDNINSIRPNVFSIDSQAVPCNYISGLDLSLWDVKKEEDKPNPMFCIMFPNFEGCY